MIIINVSFIKIFYPENYDKLNINNRDFNLTKNMNLKMVSEVYGYELNLEEYMDYSNLENIIQSKRSFEDKRRITMVLEKYNFKYPKLGKLRLNSKSMLIYECGDKNENLKKVLDSFKFKFLNKTDLFVLQLLGVPVIGNLQNGIERRIELDLLKNKIVEINKLIYYGKKSQTNDKEIYYLIRPLIKIKDINERKNKIEKKYIEWGKEREKTIFYFGDNFGNSIFIHFMYYSKYYKDKGLAYNFLECYLFDKKKMTYREVKYLNNAIEKNILENEYFKIIKKIINIEIKKEQTEELSTNGIMIDMRGKTIPEEAIRKLLKILLKPLVKEYCGKGSMVNTIVYSNNLNYFTLEQYIEVIIEYRKEFLEEYKDDESEEIQIYKQFLEFAEKELNKFI